MLVTGKRSGMWLLQLSNLLGATANAMVFIAIPWLVIELTGSATSTGLIVGVSFLPAIVVAPIAGIVIDRWGPRRVSMLADLLSAVSVVVIPVVAITVGISEAWILFAAVLGATFDPAGYTARKTLIKSVAAHSGVRLEKANSLHEALFGFGFSIGPALAAVSIGVVGVLQTFWVIAGMSLGAALAILVLRGLPTDVEVDEELGGSGWSEAVKGFRALRRDRALWVLTLFFIAVEMVYLPSEVVILPTYFESVDNPLGMGLVISAMATGGIAGSYTFDWLSRRLSYRAIVSTCAIAASLSLFGLAFFPPFVLMVIAGFAAGASWGPMGPLINTLIQTRLPESLHGRAFGAQVALTSAGPPLGMIVAGGLVERFGVFVMYPTLVALVLALAISVSMLSVLNSLGRAGQVATD